MPRDGTIGHDFFTKNPESFKRKTKLVKSVVKPLLLFFSLYGNLKVPDFNLINSRQPNFFWRKKPLAGRQRIEFYSSLYSFS
jgi:hypothetical protein